MADETEDKNARQDSDLKQSFAWGQLFAGSLIGGLAVWKLLHKMTNTEPSEWFAGLSVAYEEWRDWLMAPLELFHLNVSPTEKNVLAFSLVIIAAFVRAAWQRRSLVELFFDQVMWFFVGIVVGVGAVYGGPTTKQGSGSGWVWIIAIVAVGISVLAPILNIARGRAQRLSQLALWNICCAILWGIALLLLNWATS